jgi:polar amino acid transport system substrate-binding protein
MVARESSQGQRMTYRLFRFGGAILALAAALCDAPVSVPAWAQSSPKPPVVEAPRQATPALTPPPMAPDADLPRSADPTAVPSFWDPRRRPERPDLTRINGIRFLTEFDYPPFNYVGNDGQPAGFSVDLARMICNEIKTTCTIQARQFDTLVGALNGNGGDAIIASLSITPQTRQQVDFSDPYFRMPARFVSRKDIKIDDVRPADLEGRKVGVVAGTAHEAYLKTLFTEVELHPYPTADAARAALRRGEVDLVFGDGVALAFWLNGTDSNGCCVFRGGPFMESRFFGEGIGIAVKRGNDVLRQAFNWALFQLWENGKYTDLWLRYFPISPF